MNLNDKYILESGRVYLTGIQALVRLPIDQMRRDRRAGLNTGAFISGYEGSPLGGYDLALAKQRKLLDSHNIHFVPGVNEDLAATSVLGSQILHVTGKSKVDGVVGFWYGKGPGVDRSGDIFRHANLAGTGKNCAAVVFVGDDHTAKSSTVPHQSDFSLYNYGLPFFYPGNQQEILLYGALAVALSRHSGAWVGLKLVTDICDGGGTVTLDPSYPSIQLPGGYEKRSDARIVSPITLELEHETYVRRLEAARKFARLNRVDRIHGEGKIGILSAGKSYYDTMQALRDLGVRDGVKIGQVAMPFPLDPVFVAEFADGLDSILVVEEKRSFLEVQLREILYDSAHRPEILGKSHFPATGELDPDRIAVVLSKVLRVDARRLPPASASPLKKFEVLPARAAAFCSGCPHNRSTLLLEGQMAGGGIGCHTMAMRLGDPTREVKFITQMGGEGAPWIGMSPFVDQTHVFQNIGDGTLFHSGYLAIEACVAAGVNITFKILYNGHVAMTGGQIAAGMLPVPALTRKLHAEGVKRTVVLAEDPARYETVRSDLATNAVLRSRDELATTLRELEKVEGVTVIIYDQQCAAEKRRQRSRGIQEEPARRLVIHEEVCEGCGDCAQQSNCMSLQPVTTELGPKIQIHQSSCNKDYTCALGDCPSFISVEIEKGSGLKKRKLPVLPAADVNPPRDPVRAGDGYRIVAPGIGGTGVVTINALLATAAWIEGLNVATLDQTGTAQKGGAVVSHILISEGPIEVPAKSNVGNADLILGFDLLGVVAQENLKTASQDKTVAVVNTDVVPTIENVRSKTPPGGQQRLLEVVNASTVRGRNLFADANRIAETLFGSHLLVNVFLLGMAYQGGLIPLTLESLHEAIDLNGSGADKNKLAFLWGRKYHSDSAWVESQLNSPQQQGRTFDRVAELRDYQDAAYASEYEAFLAQIGDVELRAVAAKYLYKLMAYKDEYEVARLLTKPQFEERTLGMWEAPRSITYHLHPPMLRQLGFSKKIRFGSWFRPALVLLRQGKVLRGKPFDPFGRSAHRRQERALIEWYRQLVNALSSRLTPENRSRVLEIAALPDFIRGYEGIKDGSIALVRQLAKEKLEALTIAVEVTL